MVASTSGLRVLGLWGLGFRASGFRFILLGGLRLWGLGFRGKFYGFRGWQGSGLPVSISHKRTPGRPEGLVGFNCSGFYIGSHEVHVKRLGLAFCEDSRQGLCLKPITQQDCSARNPVIRSGSIALLERKRSSRDSNKRVEKLRVFQLACWRL